MTDKPVARMGWGMETRPPQTSPTVTNEQYRRKQGTHRKRKLTQEQMDHNYRIAFAEEIAAAAVRIATKKRYNADLARARVARFGTDDEGEQE